MRLEKLTKALFAIYLVALTWIILFKMLSPLLVLTSPGIRSINLIPFAGSLVINGSLKLSEIIMNVIIFVPFGVYLSMLYRDWGFGKKVLSVFLVSLAFEVLQYILAIGASDITDLLGNTLGGAVGVGFYLIFSKVCGGKTNLILSVLALIGTVGAVGLLGTIVVVNM